MWIRLGGLKSLTAEARALMGAAGILPALTSLLNGSAESGRDASFWRPWERRRPA